MDAYDDAAERALGRKLKAWWVNLHLIIKLVVVAVPTAIGGAATAWAVSPGGVISSHETRITVLEAQTTAGTAKDESLQAEVRALGDRYQGLDSRFSRIEGRLDEILRVLREERQK